MSAQLTSESQKALALASDAARNLNHDFVGTEHILLGLIALNTTAISEILAALNLDAGTIRLAVEELIPRGTEPVTLQTIPLTPRSKRVIEYAGQESLFMNEKRIGPEQLFLGLIKDEVGAACQILLNLGVDTAALRKEVFKARLVQMRIVERAVRPIHASTARKRKMREELLAHLSAIYDQEFTRLHDPAAALEAAAGRFGDPAELSRELQSSLPAHERLFYLIEQFVRYRAPESAARYSLRMATFTFIALTAIVGPVTLLVMSRYVGPGDLRTLSRVMSLITFATPPTQFIIWLAYIKMRDSLWGVFGSRKSIVRVGLFAALIAVVGSVYLLAISAAAHADFSAVRDSAVACGWMPLVSAICLVVLARLSGPQEIRDTLWALLDTKEATAT